MSRREPVNLIAQLKVAASVNQNRARKLYNRSWEARRNGLHRVNVLLFAEATEHYAEARRHLYAVMLMERLPYEEE